MPIKKKQIEEIKMPSDSELIQELILKGTSFMIVIIFGLIMVTLLYYCLVGVGHGTINALHYFDMLPQNMEIFDCQIGTEKDALGFGLLTIGLILIPIYCFFLYKETKQDEYKLKLSQQRD